MYAIAFDLHQERLATHYPGHSSNHAYDIVARVFAKHGFARQQGSVYFGRDGSTPVDCVLAVQDVSRQYPWFRFVVSDIRMLRVEENNDLMPAIDRQADLGLDRGISAA